MRHGIKSIGSVFDKSSSDAEAHGKAIAATRAEKIRAMGEEGRGGAFKPLSRPRIEPRLAPTERRPI